MVVIAPLIVEPQSLSPQRKMRSNKFLQYGLPMVIFVVAGYVGLTKVRDLQEGRPTCRCTRRAFNGVLLLQPRHCSRSSWRGRST